MSALTRNGIASGVALCLSVALLPACSTDQSATETTTSLAGTPSTSTIESKRAGIAELSAAEVESARQLAASAHQVLGERLPDIDPAGVGASVTMTRMFSATPLTSDLVDFFNRADALMKQRTAEGRSAESINQDADQFTAIALGIDRTYLPPWSEQLQKLQADELPDFWDRFGSLNVATFPALACRIRPLDSNVRSLAVDLAKTAGLYGATHAALIPRILRLQGCDATQAKRISADVAPSLAMVRDTILEYLAATPSERESMDEPAGLEGLSTVDVVDSISEMELSAMVVGLVDRPDPAVVRTVLGQFADGKSMANELIAAHDGKDFAWHAVLLTGLLLEVSADPGLATSELATGS